MAKRKPRHQVVREKKEAREKIEEFMSMAKECFKEDKVSANRYVAKARRTAMKFNIRMLPRLKRMFCSHCYRFLMPGENCRVRTRNGKVVYYCLECRHYMRFPYIREIKAKRAQKA